MTDDAKRGGYPGSGDGATMDPPPPIPSGYFEAVPVPPDGYVPEAKVVALQAAIDFVRGYEPADEEEDAIATILGVAARFEVYLTSKEGQP